MKVVLKATVIDRLCEEFAKAERANREVDYVVISQHERMELQSDRRYYDFVQSPWNRYQPAAMPMHATITTREFEYTGPKNMRGTQYHYRRVPECGDTFMGKPIYVVPEEYMPR